MFTITAYTVEEIKDPFGILSGKRYEFRLEVEVEEEDELYSANGLDLRVIYRVEDGRTRIGKYEFVDRSTGKYLAYELESEEEALVDEFCREHYSEAE